MESKTFGDRIEEIRQSFPFLKEEIIHALTSVDILLQQNNIHYIVVGSIALKALGVPLNRDVGDIDIEVICDEEKEKIFEDIAKRQHSEFHKEREDKAFRKFFEHKPYMFFILGIHINIWVSRKSFSHPQILYTKQGIGIPVVFELLNRKAIYHRPKDLDDFLFITKSLISMICGKKNINELVDKIDISNIEKIILNKRNEKDNNLAERK